MDSIETVNTHDFFEYIALGKKFDNNKYNQKLPHF